MDETNVRWYLGRGLLASGNVAEAKAVLEENVEVTSTVTLDYRDQGRWTKRQPVSHNARPRLQNCTGLKPCEH